MAGVPCDITPQQVTTPELCAQANICDVMIPQQLCIEISGHTDPVPSVPLSVPTDCTFDSITIVSANGTVRPNDQAIIYGYQLVGMNVVFNTPLQAQDPISCYGIICYTVKCSLCEQVQC